MREIYPSMVVKKGLWPSCQWYGGLEAFTKEISHYNRRPMAFLVMVWGLGAHN